MANSPQNAGDLFGTGNDVLLGTWGTNSLIGLLAGPTAGTIDPASLLTIGDGSSVYNSVGVGGDWSSRGEADVVLTVGPTAYVWAGPITTSFAEADGTVSLAASNGYPYLGDFDGDGYSDLFSQSRVSWGPYFSSYTSISRRW